MKPGRELDKLVARVFGWKEWEFGSPGRDGQEAFRYKTLVPPEYDGSNLQHLNMIIPHYSTDIRAAMDAWDWLEKNNSWDKAGFFLGKVEEFDESGDKMQHLGVFLLKDDYVDMGVLYDLEKIAVGETYPHAIALAILETTKEKR